jgi:hypothetical protein
VDIIIVGGLVGIGREEITIEYGFAVTIEVNEKRGKKKPLTFTTNPIQS